LDWGDQPRLDERRPPPWHAADDPFDNDDTDYDALIRARLRQLVAA
jgi:hypothetical protein